MANKSVQKLSDEAEDNGRSLTKFAAQPNSLADLPSAEAYGYWSGAFDFFNDRLFQGKLAHSLITLTRRSGVLGYFCPRAFEASDGRVAHEISMNPSWFATRGDLGSLSTFVHEMTHQWREDFGPPNRKGGKGRGGYHDAVWADRMEAVGLMPSTSGEPGGRRTGFRVTHYVIENGPFDRACAELLGAGHMVNWRDNRMAREPSPAVRAPAAAPLVPKNTRTRFVCAFCDLKAWSRASANLSCADCDWPLVAQKSERMRS